MCPNGQLCTLGTGRALEPHSHLAAIVCPGGPGRRVFLPPRSQSLTLSPLLSLSVFVPQGLVVQLKLSVTQRNQIGFHLKPASCAHCAIVLPLGTRKIIDFTRDTVIIIGFESLFSSQEHFLL